MSIEVVRQENERYCSEIYGLLTAFVGEIAYRGWNNLTDWHTYAEDVLRAALEPTFDYNLINANIYRSNAAAFDLVGTDKDGTPVIVQVSSDSSRRKIQTTLNSKRLASCAGHHLVFMFLVDTHPQYKESIPFDNVHGVVFDRSVDVLDIRTLIEHIRHHRDPNKCITVLERLHDELKETEGDYPDSLHRRVADVAERVNVRLEREREDHQSFQLINHSPIKALLPQGEVYRETVIPNSSRSVVPEGETEPVQFSQFIKDSWEANKQRHLSIVGKGGIGKTVALLTFATEQDFLDRHVPAIYIPLYHLAKRKGKKTRYVGVGKYLRRIFGKPLAHELEELSRSPWQKGPNVILLLDGHNELPFEVTGDFADDIGEWSKRPGVQLVMTSRNTALPGVDMRQLRLKELAHEDIEGYLKEHEGVVPPDNDPLWDILTTPLMLKIYDDVSRFRELEGTAHWLGFMEDSSSAGHLIWDYLQIELYGCVRRTSSAVRQTDYALCLLLVLPYVCWRMEREARFEINSKLLDQYVRDGCAYWDGKARPSNVANIEELLLGGEYDGTPRHVSFATQLSLLTTERAMLYGKTDQKRVVYTLMHQEFRDALAAVHVRNAALVATSAGDVPDELDEALSEDVKDHFSGIATTVLLNELWTNNRLRCQWKADGPQGCAHRNTIHNLLRVMRRQCYDLEGLSFARMDLRGINLFNYKDDEGRLAFACEADRFEKTWVNASCFSSQGHGGGVTSVSFSPDGRLVASGSADRSVRLWDARTGEQVAEMAGHGGRVTSVSFSPDGRLVASGSYDRSVRLWDARTGTEIESIRPIYGINLFGFDLSLAIMDDDDRKTLLQSGVHVPPPGSVERAMQAAKPSE